MKSLFSTLIFFLFFSTGAFSEDGPLKAVVPLEKPWSFYDAEGKLQGLAVSYFKALSIELGSPIFTTAVPLKRMLHGIEKGRYDLSLMFKKQAREGTVTIVAPTLPLDTLLVGLRGLEIKDDKTIENLRLATVRGALSGSWLDKSDTVKKIATANYNEALWLLKQGRVDVISGSFPVLQNVMNKQEMTWEEFNKPYFLSCRFVMLVFANFSDQYSRMETVRQAAKRLKKSPQWHDLLDDISTFAPSMLGTHVH